MDLHVRMFFNFTYTLFLLLNTYVMVHVNRIYAGARVKGPHGSLLPNPNGGKRRVRDRVYGTVVKAIGQHKWEVTFDFDGVAREVTSKSLQLASEGAGIPIYELTSSEVGQDVSW